VIDRARAAILVFARRIAQALKRGLRAKSINLSMPERSNTMCGAFCRQYRASQKADRMIARRARLLGHLDNLESWKGQPSAIDRSNRQRQVTLLPCHLAVRRRRSPELNIRPKR